MSAEYQIFWALAYCSTASALIPLFIGSIGLRKRNPLLRGLWLFCLVSFALDFSSIFSPRFANVFGNIFGLAQFPLLLQIYYQAFRPRSNRTFFFFMGLLYTVVFFAELVAFPKGLNSYSTSITSLVFIILSVAYFYFLMVDLPTVHIQRLPMFWVNIAVLIYFAGNLFLFSLRHYLITELKDDQTIYWSFHNFLNIGKNLLFAVALWQDLRKPKPI
jgi:hypothetical protein